MVDERFYPECTICGWVYKPGGCRQFWTVDFSDCGEWEILCPKCHAEHVGENNSAIIDEWRLSWLG